MPLSFEDLPLEAIKHALSFVSNVSDFLRCERTCTKLGDALADDNAWDIWEHPGRKQSQDSTFSGVQTHREKICIFGNLFKVRKYQRGKPEQILLEVFEEGTACQAWREIVQLVLDEYLPQHSHNYHHFYSLRGDTLATLIEILEVYLVNSFERAMLIVGYSRGNDLLTSYEYPTLKVGDLALLDVLGQKTGNALFLFSHFEASELEFANSLIDLGARDKIIRRTAFRGGVVKLDNDVYDPLWSQSSAPHHWAL